ncbi:esterase [Castellaniella sp.]|uniref:esterase n=1 Tax=Castellaniella sp. TaxID=1955812 RepID=UPI003A9389CA
MSDSDTQRPDPLSIIPTDAPPAQLFVVLHGESANPAQVLQLVAALRQAFPSSAIIQPYGPFGAAEKRRWIVNSTPTAHQYVELIAQAGAALAQEITRWQQQHGVNGEQTAVVGFSEGAAVALEAVSTVPRLAGRALLFSTRFASLPEGIPHTVTLHLLHGGADTIAPASQAHQVHARLAELEGDVTLDIASNVGHELHAALIHQAVVRLQTCIPLRSWEDAQGAPDLRIDEYSANAPEDVGEPPPKTLH